MLQRVGIALLAAGLLVACGPGPKPANLLTFERLRKEATGSGTQTVDKKLWKDSDNYYSLAFEAWEDGDDDEAREYGLLGTVLLHTCREQALKAKIDKDIKEFQQRYDATQARKARWAKEKARVEEAVTALQGQLALANRLAESERKRSTEREAMAKTMAAEQALAEVRQRHADLLLRLRDAEKVGGLDFAAGEYNRAKNLLNKATLEIEDAKTSQARMTLEEAATQIASAVEKARPQFDAAKATRAREETNRRLISMAHTVGASEVRVEPRGVVLVFHNLFAGKKRVLSAKGGLRLDRAGKLLFEFPAYTILIEGHTDSKGSDSSNLTLSRTWAQAAMSHYVSKGVKPTRFHASGYGESAPLEDNGTKAGRKRNRRVEVVLLYPRD